VQEPGHFVVVVELAAGLVAVPVDHRQLEEKVVVLPVVDIFPQGYPSNITFTLLLLAKNLLFL